MDPTRKAMPFLFAGLVTLFYSAFMALAALGRLAWAIAGLLVALARLAHISIQDCRRKQHRRVIDDGADDQL